MTIQLILIIVSSLIIFAIYVGRMYSKNGDTILFSTKFLIKADEFIFGMIKFVFKMYSLLFQNIILFLSNIPHVIVHAIHVVSKSITQHTHVMIEKIKNTAQK